MSMRTRVASILSLLTNKVVIIAIVAAIAMVVGAMSVGALIRHKVPFNTIGPRETLTPDPTHHARPDSHTAAVAGAETEGASPIAVSGAKETKKSARTTRQTPVAGDALGGNQTPVNNGPPSQSPQLPTPAPVVPAPQPPVLIPSPIQNTENNGLLSPLEQLVNPVRNLLPAADQLQLTIHLAL